MCASQASWNQVLNFENEEISQQMASSRTGKKVNSYRFLDPITSRMCKNWIALETPRAIPWTPMEKFLQQSTIAMVTSAGIALKTDRPFDQEGERKNPWWGDPTHRLIPRETRTQDIKVYHLHVDPFFAEQDLNCLLPLSRLIELESEGAIGRCASTHYSVMGYILQPTEFLELTAPAIVKHLKAEKVDVVLLFPA
jgi:D-proline reductase (dithiol) PrdB